MTRTWELKRLGDLCQLLSGQHIEAKDYNTDGRGVGYLTGPSDFGELYPVVSKWTEHPKVKAESGDILITVKGSGVGKVNLLNQDQIAISRQLMALRVKNANPQFVYAFISSKFDHFQSLATGAAIPGISREQVLGLELTLPPLTEQKRIVSILDEAFEGIATAKANTQQNLNNSRILFASELSAVFDKSGVNIVSLSDITSEISDGDHMPPPKSDEGVPFITIGNVDKNTRKIDFSDTFKVLRSYFDALKYNKKPKIGDVLYTVTGSFGIPVLIRDEFDFCFQRHIGLIRPKPQTNSTWLYYLLMSPQVFRQASEGATGTAQKTVSLKLLRSFQVPLVPISEQLEDVAKLDALFDESQRLESIYRRKLAALDELKKALLHKAFAGEL